MITLPDVAGATITEATWDVPSRTRRGRTHTVSLFPDSGVMQCTCEAGQYNRWCWHRDWVNEGLAGDPHLYTRPA